MQLTARRSPLTSTLKRRARAALALGGALGAVALAAAPAAHADVEVLCSKGNIGMNISNIGEPQHYWYRLWVYDTTTRSWATGAWTEVVDDGTEVVAVGTGTNAGQFRYPYGRWTAWYIEKAVPTAAGWNYGGSHWLQVTQYVSNGYSFSHVTRTAWCET